MTTSGMTAGQTSEPGKFVSLEQFLAAMDRIAAEAAERQAEWQAERQRETAERQRETAERQRETAERQRETAERQKEAAERQAEWQREAAERQKEAAERQAEWQREAAERQKEADKRRREAAERQKEADKRRRESAEEFRELKRLHEETERAHKETERVLREVDEQLKESDRQRKENERMMIESSARIDRKLDRLSENVGGLSHSLGELVEVLVAARLWEKFDMYGLERGFQRVSVYDGKRAVAEIDILLSNTDCAMAVEVKTHLDKMEYVDRHIARMELIRKFPPAEVAINGKRVMGALAGGVVSPAVMAYAHQCGFYVLELSGESVRLANTPAGFEARVW